MLGKEVLGAPLGIQFHQNVFSLVEVRAQYRTFQFRPQRIVGKSLLKSLIVGFSQLFCRLNDSQNFSRISGVIRYHVCLLVTGE